jgi:hypothetical protein
VGELDLDSVRINEVEYCSEVTGYFPDPDRANTACIKPVCPRLQLLERLGIKREMIETGTIRVEPFTCVACMLAQVKAASICLGSTSTATSVPFNSGSVHAPAAPGIPTQQGRLSSRIAVLLGAGVERYLPMLPQIIGWK